VKYGKNLNNPLVKDQCIHTYETIQTIWQLSSLFRHIGSWRYEHFLKSAINIWQCETMPVWDLPHMVTTAEKENRDSYNYLTECWWIWDRVTPGLHILKHSFITSSTTSYTSLWTQHPDTKHTTEASAVHVQERQEEYMFKVLFYSIQEIT
jgi:hypothetical protein